MLALEKRVKELEVENALLRARLNMNSTNSSMPPYSDGLKKNPKTKSLRVKSNKPSESGVRVGGKLNWFHSYSNDKITMYFSHLNRGKKAITDNGILSDFKCILVHDCWYAYEYTSFILFVVLIL